MMLTEPGALRQDIARCHAAKGISVMTEMPEIKIPKE